MRPALLAFFLVVAGPGLSRADDGLFGQGSGPPSGRSGLPVAAPGGGGSGAVMRSVTTEALFGRNLLWWQNLESNARGVRGARDNFQRQAAAEPTPGSGRSCRGRRTSGAGPWRRTGSRTCPSGSSS